VALAYQEQRPSAALRPAVECLWLVTDRVARRRDSERIVPDACPEIIVHLGDRFSRQVGGRWQRQPLAFLAGTLSRPWILRAGRRIDTFGVRFRPGELSRLFALDLQQATDRELPLEELAGGEALRLVRELRATTDTGKRFARADRWLRERLAAAAPRRPRPTGAALALIRRSHGRQPIARVAGQLGVSRRRLERAFAKDLGIRPKLFARIVRLHAALARLAAAERMPAVELALAAGYFDQSHLLRDFRGVAGRSPRADRDHDGEMARHFTRPDRVLAWLAGE
jgi:AraC-like DNA-binding protein